MPLGTPELKIACIGGFGSCKDSFCPLLKHQFLCSFLTKSNHICECQLKAATYEAYDIPFLIPNGSQFISFLAQVYHHFSLLLYNLIHKIFSIEFLFYIDLRKPFLRAHRNEIRNDCFINILILILKCFLRCIQKKLYLNFIQNLFNISLRVLIY